VPDLNDARDPRSGEYQHVDLGGAQFRDVNLRGAKFVDANLTGATFSGLIGGLVVNGVEVAPLVEAELDRLFPERLILRNADTPDRMRDAWALIAAMWSSTLDRSRALPPRMQRERIDSEWSFAETLRHLIFVSDAWFFRTVMGEAHPYCPFGLPHAAFDRDPAALGINVDAKPRFERVLSARTERVQIVGGFIADLSGDDLDRVCPQNPESGYPVVTTHSVGTCLRVVLDEEWWHHAFATRDLAVLEARD
jgi:hypothetical protein